MEELFFGEMLRIREESKGKLVIVIKQEEIFMEKRLRGRMLWYCKDELSDY